MDLDIKAQKPHQNQIPMENSMTQTKHLGAYVLYEGRLAQILTYCDRPTVGIKIIEPPCCPHCGKTLPKEEWHDIVIDSPIFREKVKPLKTIPDHEK
jgi:hypothetical protein